MNIESILQPFQRFGVHLGCDRIYKLLQNLGNPHLQVPIIHVAGTNGKGSVCAYLSSVLTEAGYRTGRYTSPHLVDWTERISLNEKPITEEVFCQLLLQVQQAIEPNEESPTQFEVITAAAWLYFAQQEVDIAVIEVGLGGRLDATNVCPQPLVSVVTSISREHWQQLGSTVTKIAGEKAGIIKAGCPVMMGQLPPDAEQVVFARATELDCQIFQPQAAAKITNLVDNLVPMAEYKSIFSPEKTITYPLALAGQIQLANSALALATLEVLQHQGWSQITETAMIQGMGKTKWWGRMQWVNWKNKDIHQDIHQEKTYKLLLDGAHNPAAAKVLREYVDSLNIKSVSWVIGMLSTKEHDKVFAELLRDGDRLYILPVPDHSTATPEELAILAQKICPNLSFCQIYSNLSSAIDAAFSVPDLDYFISENANVSQPKNLVVLCGSLYLIGYFLRSFNYS
ncbi:folylpolyglutamate synthase/dihydrofolate synthase family protein [Calothrix sp. UHCC 0171]|uniref:bifunctional folylpolyglutamate synthase/dihydrofolate synthase n=1 Tax=Calothrix sp. UHCC 0171 TaxID=3110245 RepID=UPI002B210BC6|nr:folylpolyglutamate synthase/dihydrofolate synthase family protein [Calothrix sp. UHCC 0171]MEA5573986.1 folylpolyglutamate synthase/dihydrofolate synthase family protein [Calothrix sp. UHCC 0171]